MATKTAPKYEMRKVTDLEPYARNARTHSESQVAQIAASMREFGFINPVIIDANGGIIAGHGRVMAARSIGLEEVPCLEVGWLTDAQRRAYILADNKLAEQAGWDTDLLRIELTELQSLGFDVSLTGFGDLELTDLLAERTVGHTDPDEVPAEQPIVISKPGDIWMLGNHRIACGDSTNAEHVAALLGMVRPHLMVTDPPYGVEYDPTWRAEAGVNKDKDKMGTVQNDDKADWRDAYALFPGTVCYVWHAGKHAACVQHSIEACGFEIRSQIIWVKDRFALSRGHYHWQHEPCQPPGTMVRTPAGEIPIECLEDGDSVLSYDTYSGQVVGKREGGRRIKVARRHYDGDMYTVEAGGRRTRSTDGHQFTVRFSRENSGTWCTYLMRRGRWWRIGMLRAFNSRGFGPAVRVSQEDADEMWLLSTHSDRLEAACAEQVLSVKYGIPTTHWNVARNPKPERCRTCDHIQAIYDALDLDVMDEAASGLLEAFGRRREYPMADRSSVVTRHSRRTTAHVRACNLIPGVMELPIPKVSGDEVDWVPIAGVSREAYSGPVFSMDVEKDHHYIADGIVTHNCWYAVRGQNAAWHGDRSQCTVWNIKAREDKGHSHGTQKPVECMRRPIENNSSPGQAIYDPFVGSGTTIIAAETTGRVAYAMDLNPSYVDVSVRRWQAFTGESAVLAGDGRTFDEVASGVVPEV